MLVKKTSKNQITLPMEDGIKKIREKVKSSGITEEDIKEAIRWTRKSYTNTNLKFPLRKGDTGGSKICNL